MSKPNELKGMHFGTLKVLRRAKKQHREFHWLCKCSCGKRVIIRGASLTTGKVKSCGCVHGVKISTPITHKQLLQILYYEPRTGLFYWKIKSRKYAVGDVAGVPMVIGYVQLNINKAVYLSHILAWFYMNGRWPEHEIDHWDRNRANNKWKNLRASDRILNCMNAGISKNNTSGFKGVSHHGTRFRAYCRGKHIGIFNTAEEAARAYDAVALKAAGAHAALNFGVAGARLDARKKTAG